MCSGCDHVANPAFAIASPIPEVTCQAMTLSRLSPYKSYAAWYHAKGVQEVAKTSECCSIWRPGDFQGNIFSRLYVYNPGRGWYLQSSAFLKGTPILCFMNLNPCHEFFPGWMLPNTLHAWLPAPIWASSSNFFSLLWVNSHISYTKLQKYCIFFLIWIYFPGLLYASLDLIECSWLCHLLIHIYPREMPADTFSEGCGHQNSES